MKTPSLYLQTGLAALIPMIAVAQPPDAAPVNPANLQLFPTGAPYLGKYAQIPMVFPGKDWNQATPESQGIDSAKLRAALDYLARSLAEQYPNVTLRHFATVTSGYASGLHNNVCIVVPEWRMVIARTNGARKDGSVGTPANVDDIWSEFFSRLAEAIMP